MADLDPILHVISNAVAIAFYVLFALGIGWGARRVPPTRSTPVSPSSTPQACSVDRCDERSYARTWCKYHYQRWYRYGDPLGEACDPSHPRHPLAVHVTSCARSHVHDCCDGTRWLLGWGA